jgi:hypothetical protein
MERTLEKGLAIEELEAQEMGLLPDRVEMRHRRRHHRGGRRRRGGATATATAIVSESGNSFSFNDLDL